MSYGRHPHYRSEATRHRDTLPCFELRGPEVSFGVQSRPAVLWHEAQEAAEAVAEFVRRFGVRPVSVVAI